MERLFCIYCGMDKGDRFHCCQENHFVTAEEFKEQNGEWPCDGAEEEAAYYEELERGYAKDRI